MSTYLDIETDRWAEDRSSRDHVDWMTIKLEGIHVHIDRESTDIRGERRVDPEAGVSFYAWHLDAVIDALTRLRADLPAHLRSPSDG